VNLTSNQVVCLCQVAAQGAVDGYLREKTLPSLIKKGLVASVPGPPTQIRRPARKHGEDWYMDGPPTVVLRLTPAGLEEYCVKRTRRYQSQRQDLEADFERDLERARARTLRD